jgi:dTDP-4-amino-4,6-dideoxygalactose transaminase
MTLIPINDLARWEADDRIRIEHRIQEVIRSGQYLLGKNSTELERLIQIRLDGMHVMCVGNGTDALAISINGLGLQAGDKIATAANAGGYATSAIFRMGCVPILVDVELETAQMSVSSLLQTLQQDPDIKAVIVTHLYGLMAEISTISEIIVKRKILLIEDCAQAIGANVEGREAGSWGDASTFSFYPTKNLGGLGDGGAVAFRSEKALERGRRAAQYGWSDRYVVSDRNGINSRIDEIQAAVLLERIQTLDSANDVRRSIIRRYAEATSGSHRMIWRDGASFVGHLAILVGPSRQEMQNVLNQNAVGHGIHYPLPDNLQPAWQKNFKHSYVPNSETLARQIVTIPCFPQMNENEISQVCRALSEL